MKKILLLTLATGLITACNNGHTYKPGFDLIAKDSSSANLTAEELSSVKNCVNSKIRRLEIKIQRNPGPYAQLLDVHTVNFTNFRFVEGRTQGVNMSIEVFYTLQTIEGVKERSTKSDHNYCDLKFYALK